MATMTKRLYALANGLGLIERNNNDDPFHQLVYGLTGKEHVSELTPSEARIVQAELQERMRLKNHDKPLKKKRNPAEPGMITDPMKDKVWALMYQLDELEPTAASVPDRLIGAIGKILGVTASGTDPFRWIKFDEGMKLIEYLKRYVDSAERRAAKKAGDG